MMDDEIIVDVTQEDIDRGKPNDAEHCPIARALRRETKGDWVVGVGGLATDYSGDVTLWVDYRAAWAAGFVRRFDAGKPVQPRRFVFKKVTG